MDNEQYIAIPPWQRSEVSSIQNFGGGQIVGRTLPHQSNNPVDYGYKELADGFSYLFGTANGKGIDPALSQFMVDVHIRYKQVGFDVSVRGSIFFLGTGDFQLLRFDMPIAPRIRVVPYDFSVTYLPSIVGKCIAHRATNDIVHPGLMICNNLYLTSNATGNYQSSNPPTNLQASFKFESAENDSNSRTREEPYINTGIDYRPFAFVAGDGIFFELNYEAASLAKR